MNDFNYTRTDIIFEKKKLEDKINYYTENNFFYYFLKFNDISNKKQIINNLNNILKKSLDTIKSNKKHFLIVGLGNDNNTADSVGPKVLKHLKVNSHLIDLNISKSNVKISALEPGVLGETGIETSRIVKSVVDEIKPDVIIFIDSYITQNIKYLNKSIQITNEGITPGSGLNNHNLELNDKFLGIPVIVIGVPTAIEVKFQNINIPYILSTKKIDDYVLNISSIIGNSLNEVLYHL